MLTDMEVFEGFVHNVHQKNKMVKTVSKGNNKWITAVISNAKNRNLGEKGDKTVTKTRKGKKADKKPVDNSEKITAKEWKRP